MRGERRPVVWIPSCDPTLGLLAVALVHRCRLPLDRHHLQRSEEQCWVELPPLGQARKVACDLDGHGVNGEAPRSACRRDHEPGSTADQRRQDDVGVSDDDGRQRNRQAPLAR